MHNQFQETPGNKFPRIKDRNFPYKTNKRENLPVGSKNLPVESVGKMTQIVRHTQAACKPLSMRYRETIGQGGR